MATTYAMSTEAQVIGQSLVKKKREDLMRVNIMWIFQSRLDGETGQEVEILQRGKPVYTIVRVVSGLNAFIAGGESEGEPAAFFVVIISRVFWNRMDQNQKRACIHQALCKMDLNDEGIPKTVEFDVREFNEIAKEYGPWNESLESFLEVTAQMKLPIKASVSDINAKKSLAGKARPAPPSA